MGIAETLTWCLIRELVSTCLGTGLVSAAGGRLNLQMVAKWLLLHRSEIFRPQSTNKSLWNHQSISCRVIRAGEGTWQERSACRHVVLRNCVLDQKSKDNRSKVSTLFLGETLITVSICCESKFPAEPKERYKGKQFWSKLTFLCHWHFLCNTPKGVL